MDRLKGYIKQRCREACSPPGFLIVHIGRSGSTVLSSMLNMHPRIHNAEEIFRGHFGEASREVARQRGKSPDTQWSLSPLFPHDPRTYWRQKCRHISLRRAFGFEIKPFHVRAMDLDLAAFIDMCRQDGFGRLIILKRFNYLRKVTSSLASARRMHIPTGERAALNPIRIDVSNIGQDSSTRPLLDTLRQYDADFATLDRYAAALPDHSVLKLTYEDDVEANPFIGYQKICRHLGFSAPPVSVTLGRTNPFPLRDMIANFDEVAAVLADTEFAWMLEG